MKWFFPKLGGGIRQGIAGQVEHFTGNKYASLAREICQNSLDAVKNCTEPVRVEFKSFVMRKQDFPDILSFNEGIHSGLSEKNNKARNFYENATELLDKEELECLRVSDFNTTGATGANGSEKSKWDSLVKSAGNSDKTGGEGGSFGIGRNAPFASSRLRTVFYNTLDIEGVAASQGVASLTTVTIEGEEIQGTWFCGSEVNNPKLEQSSLEKDYLRKETGTDIFIIGFEDDDWKTGIIKTILDDFMLAIYLNKLIVKVSEVEIKKESLAALIKQYSGSIKKQTLDYFEVLTSDNTAVFKEDNFMNGYGKVKLFLLIKPNMHSKVAMIRHLGMKILDYDKLSATSFAGIFYIEGRLLNEVLVKLENPEHTKWEIGRAGNSADKNRSNLILKNMRTYIKEKLEKMRKESVGDEIDPSVGEYIPYDSADTQEKKILTEGIGIDIKEITVMPHRKFKSDLVKENSGEQLMPLGDQEGESEKGGNGFIPEGSSQSIQKSPSLRPSDENGFEDGQGDGQHRNKKIISVRLAKCRILAITPKKGMYVINYVPFASVKDAWLEIYFKGETSSYRKCEGKRPKC